jgi:steroid delta-isomerase-like uncharacterized protein
MKTPKQVLTEWVHAWATHDATAAAALYHPDAVNLQLAVGTPVKGREAIREDIAGFFRAFPDSTTEPVQILEDGEWAVVEWSGGGTFLGEFAGRAPNRRRFELRRCGFFHVVDGLIRTQRGYWDKQTWFQQLGIDIHSSTSGSGKDEAEGGTAPD